MPRLTLKHLLPLTGAALILWGYRQLSIPPGSGYDQVLSQVKSGVLLVVLGGALLMVWLAKR
ncbi:hypothetical protein [Trichlorobacter ammonificans]|uniref:Uncharacterized protein n=1 Tax=Trichlorobacter ammonificans TaxID=2916410 RepID=A0ABM9D7T5_9BACT|nr:hypothetical protein [Trichlorobacter ammonificans]CAH2030469.1 protein of unknown function [Trichlorobacter ammonificans]